MLATQMFPDGSTWSPVFRTSQSKPNPVDGEIGFGEIRGRISRIQSTSTVLEAGQGRSIRVPNQLLLKEVVTIYSGDEGRKI